MTLDSHHPGEAFDLPGPSTSQPPESRALREAAAVVEPAADALIDDDTDAYATALDRAANHPWNTDLGAYPTLWYTDLTLSELILYTLANSRADDEGWSLAAEKVLELGDGERDAMARSLALANHHDDLTTAHHMAIAHLIQSAGAVAIGDDSPAWNEATTPEQRRKILDASLRAFAAYTEHLDALPPGIA